MEFNEHATCPCGSGKAYLTCCKVFHDGTLPQTALELMKSRFTAFAVGNSDYIIDTTHKDNVEYSDDMEALKGAIDNVIASTSYKKLKVLDFIDGIDEAFVTFFIEADQQGLDVSFTERSKFKRVDGKWLYLSGEFLD